jgi:hypothetical protein
MQSKDKTRLNELPVKEEKETTQVIKSETFNCDCIETWLPTEWLYFVSSLGRIKSMRTGKILSPLKTTTGYLQIQLSFGGKMKQIKIHRLVAITFIPNPENKREVNHKDGNPLNNSVSNLEWVTRSENVKHAYDTGLNSKARAVNSYDRHGVLIKNYPSAREAEKDGFSNQLIAKCCSGKRGSHKGRVWRYA